MTRFLALSAVLVVLLLSRTGGFLFACRVSRGHDMYSRVCPECRSQWPYENEYRSCPQCEVDTRVEAKRPMTPRAANLRLRGIEFERWYMDREMAREARGEPSPEDRGKAQADLDLDEVRRLEALLSNGGAANVDR